MPGSIWPVSRGRGDGVSPPGRLDLLQLGVSLRPVCGVRDYASGLADELEHQGHRVTTRWLDGPVSVAVGVGWLHRALDEGRRGGADAVLWQYSVFSYGRSGVPTLSLPFSWVLGRSPLPVVAVLHELAYPWHQGGWRGSAWAVTQRAVLPAVLAACSGAVVTVEERATYLGHRRWIPDRPVVVAPVPSGIPVPEDPTGPTGGGADAPLRVGMFSYPPSLAPFVLGAVARLRRVHPSAELWLLGAPGPDSAPAGEWRRRAAELGLGPALHVPGVAPPEVLAEQILSCQLCVFHDNVGPSSRKSSLAALLACGRPVVAVDGPKTWRELADQHAVRLVADQIGLADALVELAGDRAAREALGRRARQFYDRHQARALVARSIAGFLAEQAAAGG